MAQRNQKKTWSECYKKMTEINLMKKYPRVKRNLDKRVEEKTKEIKEIAKKFGKEYFDGERKYGYGGYYYNSRFFTEVVKDMIAYYHLTDKSKILDVGCAKGFMLYDFKQALPKARIRGIDISDYAIENSLTNIKPFLSIGNAKDLSEFGNKEFDLVISINTIHNLQLEECKQAIKEIERVGKNAFITVDAWRSYEEEKRMNKWNLTAETYMHTKDWKRLFDTEGYRGDYYWFIP